jgi:hypothetical protein
MFHFVGNHRAFAKDEHLERDVTQTRKKRRTQMKTHYYSSILITLILALAASSQAQQRPFNAEEGNGTWSAVQPAVSAAYTQYSYFNSEMGNVPKPQAPSNQVLQQHAGIAGKLTIGAPAKVGDITLNAGQYIVRHVAAGKEHFIVFDQVVENDFAPEGTSVYALKMVAKAACTAMEPLNTAATRTELTPQTNSMIASLEIRGEKVEHVF